MYNIYTYVTYVSYNTYMHSCSPIPPRPMASWPRLKFQGGEQQNARDVEHRRRGTAAADLESATWSAWEGPDQAVCFMVIFIG